jgi:pimeloyl-ACP methyl ester carboxylesterase
VASRDASPAKPAPSLRAVTIALDEVGDGEPVVLVHGVGTSRVIWRRALPELASTRHAIAIDVPGFGDSPPVGPGFSLEVVATRIADELELRVGRPYDLIGNSLGGAISLLLAAQRPSSVRRLVLAAPAGFVPRPGPVAELGGIGALLLMRARHELGMRTAGSGIARRALLWGALHDGSRIDPDHARLMFRAPVRAARLREGVAAAMACDLRATLSELDLPVGFLWGEHDRVVPVSVLDATRELRPGAPAETIPLAGHAAQMERPAEFAAAFERLLARLPLRG